MITTSFNCSRITSLCLSLALPIAMLTGSLSADELDDLLTPANAGAKLVDDSATEAWNGVVDAFRRNDLAKAKELGAAFLAANHKASPYQVLGAQVMMDLANAEKPTVTHDVELSVEMKRLMEERDALRAKYANLQAVAQSANARINKLTNNRTQGVQAGTQAYRECQRAAQEMEQANADMEAMKPEIESNKVKVGKVEVGANNNLKNDTLKLLDMLTEAGEIEAAFAVANVYIRVAGSDLEVAKKQQDVIRLREIQTKAMTIVKVIEGKQKPLVDQKLYWEALTVGEQSLEKVQQASDKDLARLVAAKLTIDPLGIKRSIAKATSESKALRELARVDALKAKAMLRDFRSKYADFPEMDTLAIAVEGERSADTKEKIAELLKSVEDLANTDPQRAREILDGLKLEDIDPVKRMALETRITTAKRREIDKSIQQVEGILSDVKSKLGGEVLQILADTKIRTESTFGLSEQTKTAANIRVKIDKSAELPAVRASLARVGSTIESVSIVNASESQKAQLNGIKAEVDVLRLAVK